MALAFNDLLTMLGDDKNFPKVQEVTPVSAQLGFKLVITPQATSGLPTTFDNN